MLSINDILSEMIGLMPPRRNGTRENSLKTLKSDRQNHFLLTIQNLTVYKSVNISLNEKIMFAWQVNTLQ